MDNKNAIFNLYWISMLVYIEACTFYSKNGPDAEADGARFIRVREDMPVGGEILNLRAYPRTNVVIKGTERSSDKKYFKLREVNDTNIQVLLDKSIDDLVDRDVPQNVLKFKIECSNRKSRQDETSFLSITVYIEDINDHTPKFLNLPYTVYIDESTPVGTAIHQQIAAFDRDKPNTPNSDVQYAMGVQEHDSGGPYFSLESPHRPSVILRRQLDFDDGQRMFEIPIVASDRGSPPKTASSTLTVLVKDSDDLPPKFTEGVYRTRIEEFFPLTGKAIKVPLDFAPPILAYDQDSINTTLIYDIISGNDRKLFWVNPHSGVIYLMREIDLEEESLPGNTFVLQMEARQKDSPLKRAVARVEIEIIDLNDNRPEFEVELYNISIVENLPSGFSVLQVNAIDRDQGENSDFMYFMVHEDPPGTFLIDPRSGWITVRDQELLDREMRSRITMNIQAIEKLEPYGKSNMEHSSVQVEVSLLDANDNTPQFEMGNLYEFKISETSPEGHVIGYITAKDPDEGRNGMLLYELQRPRGAGIIPLRLDSKTGALSVAGALKRGRLAVFVEASDQPSNPSERRFSLAVVTVEVVSEITDGSLDFVGAPYEFWVGADVPIGTSVGQIKTNLDWDVQGEVMYDLLHSYPEGVPFAVEERSGIVTVIRELSDFDRGFYEFEAVAAHFESEKQYGPTLIRRTSKSERQITSNGEVIEIDEGIVTDNQNVLVTNVTVHIVNADDERGILMRGSGSDPIEFHVRENIGDALIGQLIFQNVTRDEYRSNNGRASIFKTPRHSQFNKNSTQFMPMIDVPRRRHRDVRYDEGFYVPVMPRVYFEDSATEESEIVQEFAPYKRQFMPLKYKPNRRNYTNLVRSMEPKPFSMVTEANIVEVTVTDEVPEIVHVTPRSRMGKNRALSALPLVNNTRNDRQMKRTRHRQADAQKELKFFIANQHDVAGLISITNDGTLMTVKPLDREERDIYRLTVIAEFKQGFMSGAGIYQVIIHVDDVNDNAPKFSLHSYSGNIAENSPVGTEILLDQQILVNDADIGQNAQFAVSLMGEGSNLFLIETLNDTKQIRTTKSPAKSNHRMARAVLPRKSSKRKQSNGTQHMHISEKNQPQYLIKYIGPNVIDRELQSYYELYLQAKDRGGLGSEVKLTIFVTDVNDNAPMFEKIAVFKDMGLEILEYTNDLEIYFIERQAPDALTYPIRHHLMDPERLVSSATNFEIMQFAESTNIGTPRLIGGDNNGTGFLPKRRNRRRNNERPYPLFSILESVEVGSNILKLTAVDEDYEENAQLVYGIVTETFITPKTTPKRINNSKFFGIDPLTGELRVQRSLPAQAEILLNISAVDTGGLMDFTIIKFKVLDVNDHIPVFEKPWYTFDISEGDYSNMVLGKITATDEDFGDNGNVTYALISKDTIPFHIAPLTGILKITGDLDREQRIAYIFQVIASDNSKTETPKTSTAEVEVNILDVNDNSPVFIGYDEVMTLNNGRKLYATSEIAESSNKIPVYKAYLNRNTEPGTFVKQISAIDKDFAGNGNGLVMYALRHNQLPYFFEIDSKDGVIMTISKFSRYRGYEHINLTIIASDLGTPSRSSMALLLINLQGDEGPEDEDDGYDVGRPKSLFQHQYYEIDVQENNDSPVMLLQINATSEHQDKVFKWSLVYEETNSKNFRIDSKNGTLWLVKSLDREEKSLHRFKIRADHVTREGRNMASITYPILDERIKGLAENEVRIVIKVTDENDNFPKFTGNGKPIVAVIPRSANFGFPVTTVEATDNDIGINAEIRYSLLNEPSRQFGIDEISGRIRVLGPITSDSRVFGFDVKATDRRGADDGKSAIANVFVYILDDNRHVRLVLSGTPVDVEKETKRLTESLSEATGLDVRIRMLEPHPGDIYDPATDVYLYAVDPRSNSIVDMDELQSTMTSISIQNLTTSAHILGLAELSGYTGSNTIPNTKISHTTYNGSIRTPELATIILAFVVFAGGLATAFCVVCVRYKRRKNGSLNTSLAYAIAGASARRPIDEDVSTKSNMQMLPSQTVRTTHPAVIHKSNSGGDRQNERSREYIDVPLPQSVLSSNFNLMEHDNRCLRPFNQIQSQNQTNNNLDTSVPSLHSSGCDSGVGLSREMNESPTKHIIRMMRESQRRASIVSGNRLKPCICGFTNGAHACSAGEESSDSYEDSLKNVPCMQLPLRTSLPKSQGFRRSFRNNIIHSNRGRHSFTVFK